MDEFDAVDIVYDAVITAKTNVMIYKDASESGVTNEHIVINHLQLNELDFINKVPVNVNPRASFAITKNLLWLYPSSFADSSERLLSPSLVAGSRSEAS